MGQLAALAPDSGRKDRGSDELAVEIRPPICTILASFVAAPSSVVTLAERCQSG